MTIQFACACGRSLQTKPENAGKRTKCPACGQLLVIPGGRTETPTSPPMAPPGWIRFRCACGKQFQVQAEYAGRKTKCPSCGEPVVIPKTGSQARPPRPPADGLDDDRPRR